MIGYKISIYKEYNILAYSIRSSLIVKDIYVALRGTLTCAVLHMA